MLAIRYGRGTGVAVERVLSFQRRGQHNALPEDFAVAAVQTKQHALALGFETGRDKDTLAPDNRRGMALAGDGSFPANALRRAPGVWDVLLRGRTVAARPTPARPVRRSHP